MYPGYPHFQIYKFTTESNDSLVVSVHNHAATARSWVRVPLAVSGRVATVGQLLFAPWA